MKNNALSYVHHHSTFSELGKSGRTQVLPFSPTLPANVKLNGYEGESYPLAWDLADMTQEATDAATVYTFEYTCPQYALRYTAVCRVSTHPYAPMEWSGTLHNVGSTPIYIDPQEIAVFDLPANDTPVAFQIKKESGHAEGMRVQAQGDPNSIFFVEGTGLYQTPLTPGTVVDSWVNTRQDFNVSGYYPMIYMLHEGYGEYIALGWSSGRVRAENNGRTIRLSADIDLHTIDGKSDACGPFVTKLPAGKSMEIPPVYLGCFDGDVEEGSNDFKAWFFDEKVPQILRDDENEPLIQIDYQMTPARAQSLGIESIKWDNGWWSDCSNGIWGAYEGAWSHMENNKYKDPNYGPQKNEQMLAYGREMAQYGLNWVTYILLHDTMDDTNTPVDVGEFNSIRHPDWFAGHAICHVSGQDADLGNEECVKWLQQAMPEFLNEHGVRTWRSDFEPIARVSNKENRHGAGRSDVQYWCTVGFAELVDAVYAKVPRFRYESCSSGGSMKDLFTATKAVVINCDDLANYLSLRTTFYDGTYVLHPTQLQMPANPDDFCMDCEKFRYPVYDEKYTDAVKHMGLRTAMLGGIMYGSWSGTENDAFKWNLDTYFQSYFALYKQKVRPLLRHGRQYHVLPRPDGIHWDGLSYVDKEKGKGVLFAFKPSDEAGDDCHVCLRGLDADVTYRLTFEDGTSAPFTATGDALMRDGFTIHVTGVGSEIVWIDREAE